MTVRVLLFATIAAAVALALIARNEPVDRRLDPFTGMVFVRIPAGTFTMGSPDTEPMREAQEIPHAVSIPEAFFMGSHEVTQGEWRRVMGTSPAHFAACGDDCPVENVSYVEVLALVARLNARSGWPGFRLPTETEWEYACRAGGSAAFGWSATLSPRDANIDASIPYPGTSRGRSRGTTTPVASFAPNRWGLFDMSGNVWEWTSDNYAPYPGAVAPATPTFTADRKVIRGGSWLYGPDSARCALRYTHRPQDRGPSLGLRLAHDAQ